MLLIVSAHSAVTHAGLVAFQYENWITPLVCKSWPSWDTYEVESDQPVARQDNIGWFSKTLDYIHLHLHNSHCTVIALPSFGVF